MTELSGKQMPIMLTDKMELDIRRGLRVVAVKSIPWEMISDHVAERQCKENHGQTLESVAARCGLDASEAICVIAGLKYQTFGDTECEHRLLYAMRSLFNRGRLHPGMRAELVDVERKYGASPMPPASQTGETQ